ISEDAKEYLIKVELPEVKREDVKITMEEGTLTIAGDRKYEKQENGKKYHRVERAYGSFGRSFSLPDDASPAKVTADFKDGVLKVHLAKNEKPRPQQVEVSVSCRKKCRDGRLRSRLCARTESQTVNKNANANENT